MEPFEVPNDQFDVSEIPTVIPIKSIKPSDINDRLTIKLDVYWEQFKESPIGRQILASMPLKASSVEPYIRKIRVTEEPKPLSTGDIPPEEVGYILLVNLEGTKLSGNPSKEAREGYLKKIVLVDNFELLPFGMPFLGHLRQGKVPTLVSLNAGTSYVLKDNGGINSLLWYNPCPCTPGSTVTGGPCGACNEGILTQTCDANTCTLGTQYCAGVGNCNVPGQTQNCNQCGTRTCNPSTCTWSACTGSSSTTRLGLPSSTICSLSKRGSLAETGCGVAPSFQVAKEASKNSMPFGSAIVTKSFSPTPRSA